MVCCYGDADGDDFGTDEELCRDIDCDDENPDVYPGAPEYCDNRIDDNCNDEIDEDGCCTDNDGDGYGSGRECPGRDCDDDDPTINPGVPKRCDNNVDDNCNRRTDEDRCCKDEDRDGYGEGRVCWGYDCNDDDPTINPGMPERCGNNVDDNCDGWVGSPPWCCVDGDRDGYGVGFGCWGFDWDVDCDDKNRDVNPGVWERCGNNVDDNCDGQIDEGC